MNNAALKFPISGPFEDAEGFLEEFWQKKPCAGIEVLLDGLPVLSPDEVAWLATQTDVESRLVFTETDGDRFTYSLEQGPFTESRLSELPDTNWTLLVQDVDKHLPDFRQYFGFVSFVPDWRLDDLMISVAAPGGGVGPHIDNYDVFLVQGDGQREWLLGDPSTVKENDDAGELLLLEPFDASESIQVSPGDVLYLPPGIPHWGIATTLCTTWSIGMRAPTERELCVGAERVLDGNFQAGDVERFYVDPDLAPYESSPGEISDTAVQRVIDQGLLDANLTAADVALVLGAVATDPKAWLMPEPTQKVSASTEIHGMARLAWYRSPHVQLVFVNGVGRPVRDETLNAIRESCRTRLAGTDLIKLSATSEGALDLEWLRLNGLFHNTSDGK